ncbi:MAG TPA: hypothetical protein VJS64_16145, partial [Pyrinomonadaceae bacterium]|nr:hypothetical protein [Pyrinomonadaceae bacterium]
RLSLELTLSVQKTSKEVEGDLRSELYQARESRATKFGSREIGAHWSAMATPIHRETPLWINEP